MYDAGPYPDVPALPYITMLSAACAATETDQHCGKADGLFEWAIESDQADGHDTGQQRWTRQQCHAGAGPDHSAGSATSRRGCFDSCSRSQIEASSQVAAGTSLIGWMP